MNLLTSKFILLTGALGFLSLTIATAAAPGLPNGQTLVRAAEAKLAALPSLKAQMVLGENEDAKYYARLKPNGEHECRIEFGKMVFLTNATGSWTLIPDKEVAINCNYRQSLISEIVKQAAAAPQVSSSSANYSVEEGSWDGTACYIVKETFPKEKSDNTGGASLKVYYIGKTDGLLFSTQTFDVDGTRIGENSYHNMECDVELSDSLFDVPNSFKTFTAGTSEDYINILNNNQ